MSSHKRARLAAEGKVEENFLGSWSRSSEDLAGAHRERAQERQGLFSDEIVAAHDGWWVMRVADSVGQSAPGMVTSMMNPAFGLSLMYAQNFENASAEFEESMKAQGESYTPEEKERYAHTQSLYQTPWELVGDVAVGKAVRAVFESIPAGTITKGPNAFGDWLGPQLKKMGESAAGEVLVTTPAQTLGEAVVAEDAGVREGTTWQEKAGQTIDAMSVALGQVGGIGGGSMLVSGGVKALKGDFANPPQSFVSESKAVEQTKMAANGPDEVPEESLRFSKRGEDIDAKRMRVGKALQELSMDERTRVYGPNPTAKDMQTILKTLSPKEASQITIKENQTWAGPEYEFTDSEGGKIVVKRSSEGTVRIDSSDSKAKGALIYQTVYAWAHNNGIRIDEDTKMDPDGIYRRNSHMLLSALRFQTTRHMLGGEKAGLLQDWKRGQDTPEEVQYNIGLMGLKEAEIVMKRLSEIEGLRYDIKNQSFYDGEYRIPSKEAPAYLRRRIATVDKGFSRRVGPATFRRALAVIAAEGAGGTGSVRLVGEAAEAPRPLHGIFYSKDIGGEPASDRGGQDAARGESARVSGEAGRGESGRGLSSVEHAAQVRGWTGEIRAGWGSQLDVVVHDSAEGIADERLRDAVLKEGGGVEAFFDPADGRIHLLADRVGSKADAERLMRHEGIHWAVNGKLKGEYGSILEGVRKRISDDEWKALKKSYSDAGDQVLVEEYLAYLGQNNPKAGAWRSFVYEFKQAMKRFFGRDFDITDEDVLAFLAKANRELEKGDGPGVRVYSEADLLFAKGSERKSWEEVKVGDDFNAVKKHLPYNSDKPEMLVIRENPNSIYAKVSTLLKKRPSVSDIDGNRVLVANPEGRDDTDLLIRSEHLAASRNDRYKKENRSYDSEKARWIPNIWRTIENYGAVIQHYNDTAYVRKYGDGTIHIVFVEKGKIVDHEFYDAAVVSQRSLAASGGLKGATISKK